MIINRHINIFLLEMQVEQEMKLTEFLPLVFVFCISLSV